MPSPAGFDYHTYLASREWAQLREQVRERSYNTCEHCRVGRQQAVHHLTYERIGHENLDDLMAVCNACHEFLSGKATENPLDEFFVVSARLLIRRVPQEMWAHYLIPFDLPAEYEKPWQIERVTCRGNGCIWCKYVDEIWGLFLGGATTS